MINPKYVYMPVWQSFSTGSIYMLDGSDEEYFVVNLDDNHVSGGEVREVFFSVGEAVGSWQDEPKDKYGVIRIDLVTGKWEMAK